MSQWRGGAARLGFGLCGKPPSFTSTDHCIAAQDLEKRPGIRSFEAYLQLGGSLLAVSRRPLPRPCFVCVGELPVVCVGGGRPAMHLRCLQP
jgi:hypothetical protein